MPPVTLPSGGGWISDTDDGAVPGFVALQSRLVTGTKGEPLFDGGRLSEGEAAEGLLFFAARHVEPWEAGRSGTPEAGALFEGTQPPQGTIDLGDSFVTTTVDASLQHGLVVADLHQLGVATRTKALGRPQQVYGFQNVRLPLAVVADQDVEPAVRLKLGECQIPKVL